MTVENGLILPSGGVSTGRVCYHQATVITVYYTGITVSPFGLYKLTLIISVECVVLRCAVVECVLYCV